ncbi:MAG: glycosyltransferase [Chloroflexi bacterium]|nr:MAG: glycosyltransferase [Chloroflexota bacterium]
MLMTLYFLLPIYNEEANIASVISGLRAGQFGDEIKIVAVNDGSADRTAAILNALSGSDLIVLGTHVNMNVGAVFSSGIKYIVSKAQDGDLLVILESDQTSAIDLVPVMLDEIRFKGKDIVVASRYLAGGGYRNFPVTRLIFSHLANRLMQYVFPIPNVLDYTIFFRAYRISSLRAALPYFGDSGLIQTHGFVANAELLIKLSLLSPLVAEIPFVYDYGVKRGASKINVLRTINEYFVLVAYLRRLTRKFKDYQHRTLT